MYRFTLKNMKKTWHSYKLVILLVLAFLIIIPALVFGGTLQDYQIASHGAVKMITDLSNLTGAVSTCVVNSHASNDYFVPTKTATEWNAFLGNKPSGVVTQNMCNGDTSCVNGVCNGTETHANCPADCQCDSVGQCGASSWAGPWSCQLDLITNLGYNTYYTCASHACGGPYVVQASYKVCGNGYNAKCVSGSQGCVNQCSGHPTDTDCNGCSNVPSTGYNIQCGAPVSPYCDATASCYTNNNSCTCGSGSVGVTGYGKCWLHLGGKGADCVSEGFPTKGGANVCASGYYPTTSGAPSSGCVQCPVGTYQDSADHCSPCPAGQYNNTAGQTSCTSCDAGYYCVYGMRMKCPSGTTSGVGATSVANCTVSGS